MFRFVKQIFVSAMMIFGYNVSSANSLNAVPKCISINNQECNIRPEIINISSNEPSFYPCSIKVNKCSGSCNNTNDPYSKLCVPDVVKNMNIKVFNLMSRTNEIRYIKWHETYKCKCSLDATVCNNKQRSNNDKCRCECKELIDKRIFDKGFIWNPSSCECECEKLCNVGEYLDYSNCKCRKKLIDKLVEESSENIDEKKLHSNEINDYEKICSSCSVYIVLLVIFFIISISISNVFIHFHWYLKKTNTGVVNINPSTETVIY